MDNQNDIERVCGLWKVTRADGTAYLRGKDDEENKYLVFPTKEKKSENSPGYQLCKVRANVPQVTTEDYKKNNTKQGVAKQYDDDIGF